MARLSSHKGESENKDHDTQANAADDSREEAGLLEERRIVSLSARFRLGAKQLELLIGRTVPHRNVVQRAGTPKVAQKVGASQTIACAELCRVGAKSVGPLDVAIFRQRYCQLLNLSCKFVQRRGDCFHAI